MRCKYKYIMWIIDRGITFVTYRLIIEKYISTTMLHLLDTHLETLVCIRTVSMSKVSQ